MTGESWANPLCKKGPQADTILMGLQPISYTPQNKHGTWKWTLGKGDSYWKPSFPGSMLIFGGVNNDNRQVPRKTTRPTTTGAWESFARKDNRMALTYFWSGHCIWNRRCKKFMIWKIKVTKIINLILCRECCPSLKSNCFTTRR